MAIRGRRGKTKAHLDRPGRPVHRVKVAPRAQGVQVALLDRQAYKVLPDSETNHPHPLGVLGAQLRAHQEQEDEGWVVLHHDPANGEQPRST